MVELDRAVIEAARRSLAAYSGLITRLPGDVPAIPPAHLTDRVIPALVDNRVGDLVVVAPPESAKTTQMVSYCSWRIGNDPNIHIGYISATASQAYKRSVAIRDTIRANPRFHAVFPDVKPDMEKGWNEAEWFVQRPDVGDINPTLMAAGVGGPILGARFDLVILDDVANAVNQRTENLRQGIIDWIRDTVLTRVSPTGRVIMIATRWHDGDPVRWAVEQGWRSVHVPAIDERGESYWPGWWPSYKLKCPGGKHAQPNCYIDEATGQGRNCRHRQLGERAFLQQYQGDTHDESTSLLKRSWWRYYRGLPTPAEGKRLRWGVFVDMAHGEGTAQDNTSILLGASDGVNFYAHDVVVENLQFPELERRLIQLRAGWTRAWELPGVVPIYVEKTPGSLPLIQSLRKKVAGVVPWDIEGRSKVDRVSACSPVAESGNAFLRHADWNEAFVEEASAFPMGAHDDRVDTWTMFVLKYNTITLRAGPA